MAPSPPSDTCLPTLFSEKWPRALDYETVVPMAAPGISSVSPGCPPCRWISGTSPPHDVSILSSAHYRDVVAESILAAVKRVYLLGKNDRPTGTFTFDELLAHELSAGS